MTKTSFPELDAVHDGRHRLRDLPLERESMPYIISLPEHGLATAIYTWVNKDNLAGGMFTVCGAGTGESPPVEVVDGIDLGSDADFDDWNIGLVHVEHALDLRTARIRGNGERVQLDATFEATHPAYAYSTNAKGCPPFAATDRLEQSGRMRGTITVDGRAYEFDTTGARDHSWGTRDWNYAQHWKWVHAQTDDTALHFWEIYAAGRTDLFGYVVRDGEMAEVTGVDVDFTVDEHYRQSTITARIEDSAGRTVELAGEYFAHFEMPPEPTCILVEGGMRCTLDGVQGRGWSEFMWPAAYLEHLRTQTHT
jgi:hypothetical protein